MSFLLDTNICIYIIKNNPKKVREKFKSLDVESVAISSITLSELTYGAENSSQKNKNLEALKYFIIPLEIYNYDEEAAYHYGEIRAMLKQKGQIIGPMDLLIAAHARSLKSTLITNNIKEFKRVPDLKIENWL